MKILIVGPAYPFRGGLATYNQRLAEVLIEQGHEVHIQSYSLQYPSFLFPGKTQLSTDPAPKNLIIHSDLNSIHPLNWIRTGMKRRKEQYDLVVFRYWMSFMAPAFGTLARILKANKKTRILAICDNLIPHEKRFFDTPLTNYFIQNCDGFLTMSQSVKTQLEQWPVTVPVVYTPHPMYDMFGEQMTKIEARKKLGIQDERVCLFFGFIRKYKGLHLLLDALADERVRALHLKVIIAGEFYEDAKPYHEHIARLGLENHLILATDFIPNSEVSTYFAAADAVIQPYLNATQSGVTQIAYFYDKPMIVTHVGGLAELVPHGKVGLVAETNATSLADAIVQFYSENMEAELIPNIRVAKQAFTWETLTAKLLSL